MMFEVDLVNLKNHVKVHLDIARNLTRVEKNLTLWKKNVCCKCETLCYDLLICGI